jgi:hypothetical protein
MQGSVSPSKVRPVVEPSKHQQLVDAVDHFASLFAGGVETEVHQNGETVEGNKQGSVLLRIVSPPAGPLAPVASRRLAGENLGSQPSVATRDRSAAIVFGASPVRSLMTRQGMVGSESRSHLRCAGRAHNRVGAQSYVITSGV